MMKKIRNLVAWRTDSRDFYSFEVDYPLFDKVIASQVTLEVELKRNYIGGKITRYDTTAPLSLEETKRFLALIPHDKRINNFSAFLKIHRNLV